MEENDSCQTPDQKHGKCIIFKTCAPVFSIIEQQPISKDDRKFVMDSQCGKSNGKTLVCCPEPEIGVIGKWKKICD